MGNSDPFHLVEHVVKIATAHVVTMAMTHVVRIAMASYLPGYEAIG